MNTKAPHSLNGAECRRLDLLESTVNAKIDGFREVQRALMAYYSVTDTSVTTALALLKRWDAGERRPTTDGRPS